MAKNRSAQQHSPELPKLNNPALNQQGRRPLPPIHPSPRLKMKNQKKPTLTERRRRVNPTLHQPLPWYQWHKLLVQLIVKRPLLLLLTFCGGMLLIAGIAAIGLTRPEQGGKLKSQPTPAATLPSPTSTGEAATTVTPQTEQNPPSGLYVALGAGTLLGTWLLHRKRLKLAGKKRHKPLPKIFPDTIPEESPVEQQNNSKPIRRKAPASRESLVANSRKIPVADSMMRWSNGQSLLRNSQKVLTDTTAKRRKQSISSQ